APRIRGSAVPRKRLPEFRRIHVRIAAGQQDAVAPFDDLFDFGRSLIEGNTDWQSTGEFNRAFVLRNRALPVLVIGRVRHGNGDARPHQPILSIALNVFFCWSCRISRTVAATRMVPPASTPTGGAMCQ